MPCNLLGLLNFAVLQWFGVRLVRRSFADECAEFPSELSEDHVDIVGVPPSHLCTINTMTSS